MVNSWKDIALSRPSNRPVYDEAEANKSTKGGSSNPDQGKIQNLLIQRNQRAKRNTERKAEDRFKGIRTIKGQGNLMKFKVRRTKGEEEEYLWMIWDT